MKPTMYFLLGSLLVLLVASTYSFAQDEARGDGQPPDIVVILIDDLGWHDVGFTGGRSHKTPNVDRLAAESTVFSNAYSDGPNCAPTRASLLTGLATPRHGVITVMSSKRGKAEDRKLEPVPNKRAVDPATPTIAGMMRDAGWRTAHVGKFHIGSDPLDYGFTESVAGTSRGHPKSYTSPYLNSALEDGPEGEYLTDRLAAEAVSILEDADERPLFLHLAFYTVHTPIQPRPDLLEASRAANPGMRAAACKYDAMVAAMDEAVGKVLEAVERRDRPCMVVFASDNGGVGNLADNGPLRGAKGMLYEGGIRVPLAIRWPMETAPRTESTPVLLRDLAPTILAVAEVEHPDVEMDGRSLAGLMSGDAADPRPLHWHFPAYLEGRGDPIGPWRTSPAAAVRDGSWKMIEFFEDGHVELYDLANDPGEQVDVSKDNEAVVLRLQSEMSRWRDHVDAAMPTQLVITQDEDDETLKGGS